VSAGVALLLLARGIRPAQERLILWAAQPAQPATTAAEQKLEPIQTRRLPKPQ
jgi:hypothetical protein